MVIFILLTKNMQDERTDNKKDKKTIRNSQKTRAHTSMEYQTERMVTLKGIGKKRKRITKRKGMLKSVFSQIHNYNL